MLPQSAWHYVSDENDPREIVHEAVINAEIARRIGINNVSRSPHRRHAIETSCNEIGEGAKSIRVIVSNA